VPQNRQTYSEAVSADILDMDKHAHAEQGQVSDPPADRTVSFRGYLNRWLFDVNSPAGRRCNLSITAIIIGSAIASMAGTVEGHDPSWYAAVRWLEIASTWLFASEFLLRLYAAKRPMQYLFGIYGLIDLLTILPMLLFGQANIAFRLLRVVRLIKLLRYFPFLGSLLMSMRSTVEIVLTVICAIALGALVAGNLLYLSEPETFGNAFVGAWWSMVTMAGVGFGDMVPHTVAGRTIAVLLMAVGLFLFAVMTGLVGIKVARAVYRNHACSSCSKNISSDDCFCPHCGSRQSD